MKLLSLLLILFSTSSLAAANKPNILVIYSDDHGWADLGVQGVDRDIRTPQLDQLARDGVRCTRGYVSAPQCVPSRAGVLTGRYQQRFGMEDNNKGALPLSEITIAERLKPAGYLTGQVGKWHLDLRAEVMGAGKKDRSALVEHMPHGQGFDEYFRGELTKFYASHDLQNNAFPDAPHLVEDKRFRVDVQTEAALAFLKRRESTADQPWFLYLAYFTPHVPLESPEPWFSKTPKHLPIQRRQALAMMAAMDHGIGQIRSRLKEMGQQENTLIFFIGDNGAPTHEGHWDGSINKPMLGEKGMLTDGGTRVPFLVCWPGTLPAGTVYEKPVMNLDVAATANALAGLPADAKLDGVNLIPFLKGENTAPPHEHLFWRWRTQAAVLEFPWKLIRFGADEQFLFDTTTPEGEKTNLIAAHPDIAARLNARLKAWSDELQPPGLPTEMHAQDAQFYAEHIDPRFAAAAPKKPKDDPNAILGWLCRNGTLSRENGALLVKADPAAKSPPFLTFSPLDFLGPARLTIRTRGQISGAGSVSYRIRHETDFDPKKRVAFEWEPETTTVRIGATSRLIHLRIYLPANTQQADIERITLQREGQPPHIWDFTTQP
ncbi:MAG: sulfatase-like hydrolase/transferase [Verrucomicrobiaceae bacterium]|nr:sulfatase-like hydrolase/transferase [Verrucomicrobiaceae bacterium]